MKIETLQKLVESGTKLPWSGKRLDDSSCATVYRIVGGDSTNVACCSCNDYECCGMTDEDEALILAAINHLPRLLELWKAAKAAIANYSFSATSDGTLWELSNAILALESSNETEKNNA